MKLSHIFAALLAVIVSTVSASKVPRVHSCKHKRVLRHNPPALFDPAGLGFSQVTVDSKNAVAYISGQTALGKDGRVVEGSTVPEQLVSAKDNLGLAMASLGLDTPDLQAKYVLKLTMYIVGYEPEYLEAVKDVGNAFGKPSNTVVGIEALAMPELKVEIEAIVALPAKNLLRLKFAKCVGSSLIETSEPKENNHEFPTRH